MTSGEELVDCTLLGVGKQLESDVAGLVLQGGWGWMGAKEEVRLIQSVLCGNPGSL